MDTCFPIASSTLVHFSMKQFVCMFHTETHSLICLYSGAEIQPGPVCEQALPGPGEDREEQQAGGPDPGQDTRLERCHGPSRGLL